MKSVEDLIISAACHWAAHDLSLGRLAIVAFLIGLAVGAGTMAIACRKRRRRSY